VHRRILESIRAVPGVKAATLSFLIPLFGGNNWPAEVRVPGDQPGPGEETRAWITGVTPGFFATTGVVLAGGRDFTDADRAGAAAVGIVNRAFARRYFGTANPLDRSVAVSLTRNQPASVRIVGVAGDAKYEGLRAEPKPMLYLPMPQVPEDQVHLSLFLRSEGEPLALEQRVRDAVEAAAPGLIVRRVRDMAGERRAAVTLERLAARLAGFVGGMALVLSAIGLYGIVAYSVTRRTSEIGVRIALGAGTRDVVWLVARETLALVGAGVLLGIPLSYLGAIALRTQLYGVASGDPRGALLAVLLLGAAGAAASTLPARRAAGIDPRIALNAD
jgi:predicted permease